MRITLVTPLYPPDVAEPAPYIKELAGRLAPKHTVSVLLYGRCPEQVRDVSYRCVDKRRSRIVRIILFTRALSTAARNADILYVENGPSTELPLLITSIFFRTKYILHLGDRAAHQAAQQNIVWRLLERLVMRRADAVVDRTPQTTPEILPFVPYPEKAMAAYATWWKDHLTELDKLLKHD